MLRNRIPSLLVVSLAVLLGVGTTRQTTAQTTAENTAQITVPGHTAYVQPDPWGARVRENQGVLKWKDDNPSIRWWGLFKTPGKLRAQVLVRGNPDAIGGLKLRIGPQEQSPVGTTEANEQDFQVVDFGEFSIALDGPSHVLIELTRGTGPALDVQELRLDGPASAQVHFNLKERRNAASVHLMYSTAKDEKVDAFYTEVVGVEEPVGTFYMACGWHRGYFGMQVNSKDRKSVV